MAQSTPPTKNPATLAAVTIMLVIGIFGTLWVPLYARATPMLGDFPFFYWYLFLWVIVIAILTFSSYMLLRSRPAPGAGTNPGTDSAGRAEM